ncbi:peptide deformylase [Candidatus Arthromitus sp. SFB-mouse-Japan]|uniref:peptide deformylase n=1 Tax=unclassified Candidatus Neoarthromitus TaxID=2638829 RepID=UPI00021B8001|nr:MULTISPECIES: peptide deformylase [unclassified Candidatus Arthromitus]EIA21731.1 Peptide deformylase [Candidatus Arthromitus sp. SFB-1]EIA27151.1 Peptide deformylase [Candidatus Arthromitus sp. SFB-co]EIA30648.1 Peptide deformylase [Candidatus Arthromitus sp. SFB-mouse-SU]AID44546.1 Peptide deformylase [Candidatus Arthromitus sp. SFB-mouse-NL]EGX28946.1 peptide deformylase [Candidatus Arthromitus sp. SFB-mouse-NYU]
MALRQIRVDGDEILRKISKKVDVIDDSLKSLVDDMFETMYHADGVGLAAPQIGILKRIIVIDIEVIKKVMINPEIISESTTDMQDGPEGCLSVPGIEDTVRRPKLLTVRYMNLDGEIVTEEARDLYARVICHEVDHLNGILFTDKVLK